MPTPTQIQANQAAFQTALLKLAYQKAAFEANHGTGRVGFDFRGRAVYDLQLGESDYQQIIRELRQNPELKIEESKRSSSEALKRLTGLNFTNPIRCLLDLTEDVEKESEIYKAMQDLIHHSTDSLGIPVGNPNKMSVIPLYEELLCNIEHLDAAVRERMKDDHGRPSDFEPIQVASQHGLKAAKAQLQKEINDLRFLNKDNNDIRALNVMLDKKRAELQKKLKKVWFDEFLKSIKGNSRLTPTGRQEIFEKLTDKKFKKIYKESPAHQYDVLGSDFINGTLTYITNSGKRTARSKATWKSEKDGGASAFRFLIRNGLSLNVPVRQADGTEMPTVLVRPRPLGQVSARVPSVANLDPKKENDIKSIVKIFQEFHKEFDAFADKEQKGYVEPQAKERHAEENNAIVYNLLTSLDPWLEEQRDKKNRQNESARRILAGAHRYNREAQDGKFVWVQNISVNRHSNNLGEFFALAVHKEATLMTDIALLYTLQQNIADQDLKLAYRRVLFEYKAFLKKSAKPEHFYQSAEGKRAAAIIKEYKNKPRLTVSPANENLVDRANAALLKIFRKNLHYDKKYGNLVQSLSIFVEKRSVAGCKSANERHEDVQKRVGVLIGFEAKGELSGPLKQAFQWLMGLTSNLDILDKVLAQSVNEKRMNGDENAISQTDQAGPSKLQLLASSFARGVWNAGKTLFGLATASSLGLGAAVLGFTLAGFAFPPLNLALAIYAAAMAVGVVAVYTPKLWGFAKFWMGMSSIGLAVAVAYLFATAAVLTLNPLGLALAISLGVLGFGISTSAIGGLGLKAKNTNHGCSPVMTHCVNDHAANLQCHKNVGFVVEQAEKAMKQLKEDDNPKRRGQFTELHEGDEFGLAAEEDQKKTNAPSESGTAHPQRTRREPDPSEESRGSRFYRPRHTLQKESESDNVEPSWSIKKGKRE